MSNRNRKLVRTFCLLFLVMATLALSAGFAQTGHLTQGQAAQLVGGANEGCGISTAVVIGGVALGVFGVAVPVLGWAALAFAAEIGAGACLMGN